MRGGRRRVVHVGQLNGGRGRSGGVWHCGTVVNGTGLVTTAAAVRTGTGLIAAAAAAGTAGAAGRRRVNVRAAVRPVGRVRRGCAGTVAAAPGRHAAALSAGVIVCRVRNDFKFRQFFSYDFPSKSRKTRLNVYRFKKIEKKNRYVGIRENAFRGHSPSFHWPAVPWSCTVTAS